ncbi:MAG: ABC transporter permease [Oscillospiraceae bacterium]|nr:ABC transporter permease [Oscillospiraceae bacterium]MCL2277822.1 ABC transporter permease [Oscillospiraceae bacterium]
MLDHALTKVRNIRGKDIMRFLGNNAALFAFLLLFIMAIILRGEIFLQPVNILNIMRHNAIIGIIALGMTLVIVLGGVSLSVGAQLALVGWISIEVFNATRNIFLAMLACVAAGIITGLLEGVLVAKFKVPSFIVTLGTMTIFRSIVLYGLTGGGLMVGIPPGGVGADRDVEVARIYQNISNVNLFQTDDFIGIPLPIIYWIALCVLMYLFTSHTATGRHIFATGSNEKAAKLSGIKVDKIRILGFAICGAMVALGAVVETARVGAISSAATGVEHNLDAIAAVVIGGASMAGGKGRISGTFFGVLTLGVMTNLLAIMGVDPFLHGAARGLIVIGAVLLQRRLDGTKEAT